jgi:hypothetical protein
LTKLNQRSPSSVPKEKEKWQKQEKVKEIPQLCPKKKKIGKKKIQRNLSSVPKQK